MKVFVTGASGWIGSAVVPELLAHGHTVLGLARSDDAAQKLRAAGAEVHRGSLDDPEGLAAAAAACDGVVHLAFQHDFSQYAECARKDRDAISAMAAALADGGRDRPLVITSATMTVSGDGGEGGAAAGGPATEDTVSPGAGRMVRGQAEEVALGFAAQGVRATVVRLPPSVHDVGDQAFVPALIGMAKAAGASAYVGEGTNRWPAVHRRDAARLYRLALEKGAAGARFHAVGDEGIAFKDIAAVIGKHLGLPVVSKAGEEVAAHFGFLKGFAPFDNPTSGALTQERLGWEPEQPGLLEDMAANYFKGAESSSA